MDIYNLYFHYVHEIYGAWYTSIDLNNVRDVILYYITRLR